MRYRITNPHNPPVVVASLDDARKCVRDDYFTAFDGSGDLPGLADATERMGVLGGRLYTFTEGGAVVVRPTLR